MDELDLILDLVGEGLEPEDAEIVKQARYGFYNEPLSESPFDGEMVGLVKSPNSKESPTGDSYDKKPNQEKARALLKRLFTASKSRTRIAPSGD